MRQRASSISHRELFEINNLIHARTRFLVSIVFNVQILNMKDVFTVFRNIGVSIRAFCAAEHIVEMREARKETVNENEEKHEIHQECKIKAATYSKREEKPEHALTTT